MKFWSSTRNMIVSMLSKALGWPGFGYHPPSLKVNGMEIGDPKELERKTDEVVRQVELLEWELRRREGFHEHR